mmetsp:Transcript_20336/g.59991  ORF Transcript_20336/g.59991 Transcript_20336/m.59991 type:complete len:214 (-) Transcript_20336:363-1004(-)
MIDASHHHYCSSREWKVSSKDTVDGSPAMYTPLRLGLFTHGRQRAMKLPRTRRTALGESCSRSVRCTGTPGAPRTSSRTILTVPMRSSEPTWSWSHTSTRNSTPSGGMLRESISCHRGLLLLKTVFVRMLCRPSFRTTYGSLAEATSIVTRLCACCTFTKRMPTNSCMPTVDKDMCSIDGITPEPPDLNAPPSYLPRMKASRASMLASALGLV